MIQHAGHFDDAPQLHLAPVAPHAGRAQRGHQLAGFGTKLGLRFNQAAHLFLQRAVSARPRLFQLLDLGIHFFERFAHRPD